MTLCLNVAEVNLVNQLVRDSRALIARFTAAKSTPIHDSIVIKCERALDDVVRMEVAHHERQNKKSVRGTKGRQT